MTYDEKNSKFYPILFNENKNYRIYSKNAKNKICSAAKYIKLQKIINEEFVEVYQMRNSLPLYKNSTENATFTCFEFVNNCMKYQLQ